MKSGGVDWEERYRKTKTRLWKPKAHAYSRRAARYVENGRVLDLGSGEGYDCLYFARKSYQVTAIDISPTAIKRLLRTAKQRRLPIKGLVKNITEFAVRSPYDIIVSYGVLHFLGIRFKSYLLHLKRNTLPGGVHAFYIFGNRGDFYSIAKQRFYFPSEKELKNIYADWKILKFEKKNIRLLVTKGDNGEILYNTLFKILAWNSTETLVGQRNRNLT